MNQALLSKNGVKVYGLLLKAKANDFIQAIDEEEKISS